MQTGTIKITSKGQITIPKKVREFLRSDTITMEIRNDQIILHPVNSVAGLLKDYQKATGLWEDIRDQAWNDAINDRQ